MDSKNSWPARTRLFVLYETVLMWIAAGYILLHLSFNKMDRYEFKVQGPKEKCAKLFLSSEEVKTLCMESLLDRILTRFSGLRGKEVSLKYADKNDWMELPADDSFINMIETAKDSARENFKVIELKICELAQTPQETASHKRLCTLPLSSPKSGSVHVANKPKHLMA